MKRSDILVKIDLAQTSLSGVDVVIMSTNFPFSNISKTLSDKLERNDGANLMVLGDSTHGGTTLSESDFWIDKDYRFNGWTGGLTNDNGIMIENPNGINLTVKAYNNALINNFIVFFDKNAQQWATEAYLDGNIDNKVYNNDGEWAIKFTNMAESHTITFTKWNRPNYNARITYVAFHLDDKIFDKRWYNNISLTQQLMPLQPEPFFDVMSSVGSVQFNDINGELRDYAEDGILQPDLLAEIIINDYVVATAIVNEWGEYQIAAKQLTSNLVDRLSRLDNEFGGMILKKNQSAWQVLEVIQKASGLNFNANKKIVTGKGINLQEKTIKEHLQSIIIQYAFLKKSTMREALVKICQIGMLLIYFTASGNIVFDTARPRITSQEKLNIVDIPAYTQESDWQETIMPKNSYTGVNITENNLTGIYSDFYNREFRIRDDTGGIDLSSLPINAKIITKNGVDWIQFIDVINLGEDITNYSNTLSDLSENGNWRPVLIRQSDIGESTIVIEQIVGFFTYAGTIESFNFDVMGDERAAELYEYRSNNGSVFAFNIRLHPEVEVFSIQAMLRFDIFKKNPNTLIFGADKNLITLESNELLQNGTKINLQSIVKFNSECIIDDYSTKNGIRTASVTVFGSVDFEKSNGEKVVIWNGNTGLPTTLEKGMIVRGLDINGKSISRYKDDTDRIWKITGINFTITGSTRFQLQLRECF